MGIPRVYRKSGEKAIASYNFTDIAEGTGIVIFKLATARDSSATLQKILIESNIYSDSISTETAGSSSGSATKTGNTDFDLTIFNLPKIIGGTAFVNIGWGCEGNSNNQGGTNAFLIVKIRKWDGSTETDLGEGKSSTIVGPESAGSFTGITSALKIDIPKTHFKKGNNLRVTVEEWTLLGGGSNPGSVHIGHDPQNRDGDLIKPASADIITKSNVHIPFVFDL